MSAFIYATSSFIEKFYNFVDTSYRPMDMMGGMTYEQIKKKLVEKHLNK